MNHSCSRVNWRCTWELTQEINPLCAQSVISHSRTQVNRSYSWDRILARTHTGKKTFMCTKCNKLLSDSGKLKVHMRTHTGEKPFVCTQCNELLMRNQINWMFTRELTQNVISRSRAQTNWRCTWGRTLEKKSLWAKSIIIQLRSQTNWRCTWWWRTLDKKKSIYTHSIIIFFINQVSWRCTW
jgi:phage FluMu protein Com